MNYKIYIYAIVLLVTVFCLSGVNFTNVFRKNHQIEAKISVMLLAIAVTYLVTNFIYDIINL